MATGIYIDGPNYTAGRNRAARAAGHGLFIDFNALSAWLAQQVGDETISERHFVVSYPHSNPEKQEPFDRMLYTWETFGHYVVHRQQRAMGGSSCGHCGTQLSQSKEKGVDTKLVALIVQHAAQRRIDSAVLVSGDRDLIPAIQSAEMFGVPVHVAYWDIDQLAGTMKQDSASFIDLARAPFVQTHGSSASQDND